MRAAGASKPQIGFHTCQVFTHPPLPNLLSQLCDGSTLLPFRRPIWKIRFQILESRSSICFPKVKSFELKAGSEVCGRGKGGASWPSHCHSSISVRHNLQQQVTATATTCQKAKVLNEHQPSVDTVSRLSLAWNCQPITSKHLFTWSSCQEPLAGQTIFRGEVDGRKQHSSSRTLVSPARL